MDFVSHGKMHVPDQAVRHFVDRGYREGAPHQWARELYKNSQEAGATRIEFGIERQAADSIGVFRRTEIDNGHGMDDEHIVTFYKMLGVGSKPVGGPHENFAIGAKVSLLPWNAYGLVVISRRDGVDSMIWARRDKDGDYGLREWEIEDDDGSLTLTPVVEPYDDPDHGCDWRKILPDWVGDHGTAVVLLGNDPKQHTIDGDPRYPEEAQARGLDKYLSSRLATLSDDLSLTVIAKEDLTDRPKSRRESRDAVLGRRDDVLIGGHARRVLGLGALLSAEAQTGFVQVDEHGTQVYFALQNEGAPSITDRLPTTQSFIAFEYDGELYEHETHSAKFRMFGIAHEEVRKRLWLIIKPPTYDPATAIGVYPNQARSKLMWRGNGLPVSDWAHNFAKNLPPAIQEALSKAYAADASDASTIEDDKERRERLAARFGSRWRAIRYVINRLIGTVRVDPTDGQLPRRPRKPKGRKKKKHAGTGAGGSGSNGAATLGSPNPNGEEVAAGRRVAVDLPKPRWSPATAFGDEAWAAARWLPNEGDSGIVQLNQDHPLFIAEIQQWQGTRANHLADEVRKVVMEVYGDLAVAHVAHIRNFTGTRIGDAIISADKVEDMLSPSALTCALSGLLGAEAMIQTRLGGRFGRAA